MPRSSNAASVRVAYIAPLAPVTASAIDGFASAGGIQRHGEDAQIQDADVAVQIEGALDLREIVRADERLLEDEQRRHHGDAREVYRTERGDQCQRDETTDGDAVHQPRDSERTADAEADRDGTESVGTIEIEILTGVQHVEAADPRADRQREQPRLPAPSSAGRDPAA